MRLQTASPTQYNWAALSPSSFLSKINFKKKEKKNRIAVHQDLSIQIWIGWRVLKRLPPRKEYNKSILDLPTWEISIEEHFLSFGVNEDLWFKENTNEVMPNLWQKDNQDLWFSNYYYFSFSKDQNYGAISSLERWYTLLCIRLLISFLNFYLFFTDFREKR